MQNIVGYSLRIDNPSAILLKRGSRGIINNRNTI